MPFAVGRQMGIISHSVDPNHGYVQWIPYGLDIPYNFAAGKGNKVTLFGAT